MKNRLVLVRSRVKPILMFAAGWIVVFGMVALSQTDPQPQSETKPSIHAKKPLAFEVVSIRRSNAGGGPVQFGPTPDGFHSLGLPLFAIFQMAYAPPNQRGVLPGNRIAGSPNWMQNEHYDVVARVDEADVADWQKPQLRQTILREMLQTMLAERFKVVIHHESKEVPVYELMVAKGGPKFKQAETVDTDKLKLKYPNGGRMSGGGLAVQSSNGIQFYGISMGTLAQTFLSRAGRPVVDKTGLTGDYDLMLPSSALPRQPPPRGASQLMDAQPPPTEDEESIFTTLPKALGLRLQPAKDPVDMLVIDHVERPTEN
jgi:uncharacterized protein (TIGR03435 family)